MLVLYIVITLIFGAVCFFLGASYITTSYDGMITIKKFNSDGSSVCHVQIMLKPEEIKKRKALILRCRQLE